MCVTLLGVSVIMTVTASCLTAVQLCSCLRRRFLPHLLHHRPQLLVLVEAVSVRLAAWCEGHVELQGRIFSNIIISSVPGRSWTSDHVADRAPSACPVTLRLTYRRRCGVAVENARLENTRLEKRQDRAIGRYRYFSSSPVPGGHTGSHGVQSLKRSFPPPANIYLHLQRRHVLK